MDAAVFDRAAFHRHTVAALGLSESQAWVHSGMFFGWAADRGLVASWLLDRTPDAFTAFAERRCTGPELLAVWDGNLLDDMFTDEGLAFVAQYFPSYLADYREALCEGLPSDYHAADTWENYARIVAKLDERHQRFRQDFDPASPRLDLRSPAAPLAFVGPAWLPTVELPDAIAIPNATIGMVASRPETLCAVDEAERRPPHWFVLRMPGVPLAVGATVTRRTPSPGGDRLLVQLLARLERQPPPGPPPFQGAVWLARVEEPAWMPEHEGWTGEIRSHVGTLVARRRATGQPPGPLALALAGSGLALLDAVAGDLLVERADRARFLSASEVDDRLQMVVAALRRATA